MSALRSVLTCTRSMTMFSRSFSMQGDAAAKRISKANLGFRFPGQRNLSQVAAPSPFTASRYVTDKLLKTTSCLSQKRFVQTKSDTEMSDFLREEIQAEKESLKESGKAVQVKGFDVETNNAEVVFKKKFGSEEIKVTVNVNHSVDAEIPEHEEPEEIGKPEGEASLTKMVCKPNFHIEILKGGYTLAFNCAMSHDDRMEDEGENVQQSSEGEQYPGDQFNIEEFSIYKGEFKESAYVISGEIMDGSFYDNLMNMLDERGINSDFVQEVTDFCTLYEQKLYVNLLEHLQDIIKAK